MFILDLLVKHGVFPGPKKLPQSVNGNYGRHTHLGNRKGEFFSTIQKVLLLLLMLFIIIIIIIVIIIIIIIIIIVFVIAIILQLV